MAHKLLAAVVAQRWIEALMSHEHFSVDGTLIQAWACHRSFQPKPEPGDEPPPGADPSAGRNARRDWRGQQRSNRTHASTIGPDARLARSSDGPSSILADAGHVPMENRTGLVAHSC